MIAFIAAECTEFGGLRRHLRNERRLRLPVQWAVKGELNRQRVVLAANGPGPALAAAAIEAVEEYQKVAGLVSYGFCGALDPALAVNDVFAASEIRSAGLPPAFVELPREQAGNLRCGTLLSVDRVIGTTREKAALRSTGASVVEMEATALAAHARAHGIPFYCIRVITDSAADEFPLDFNQMRDAKGRFSRAKMLAEAARHPVRLFPELLKLNQRAKAAAAALGDFVATCQF